jgi:predicted nucleotidyltransferase
MVTQSTALKIAKKFVAEVQAKGLHVRTAILFGSYARNKAHKWSDIDLAISADEFGGGRVIDLRLYADIILSNKDYTPLELHTYNTAYFQEGDPFINEEIKPKGIVIL